MASSVSADEELPKGVRLLKPDQIKWVKTPSGRELAYLHGHPDKPGPYIYLVKWPPYNKALAHTHPDDRYVRRVRISRSLPTPRTSA